MKRMYPEERQAQILEIVRVQRKVGVDELAERFDVTGATIRADLRELHNKRLLRRTHGGALIDEQSPPETPFHNDPVYRERMAKHRDEKIAIGSATAALLRDGDNVIIDDGSTNLHVVRSLRHDLRATILSNGVDICYELVQFPNVVVYSTGGKLNKDDFSYYGSVASSVVDGFTASMAILGVSGVSIDQGLSTPSEEKAQLKKIMIERSERVVIVADSTKIRRSSFIQICELDVVDTLVTDEKAPQDFIDDLQAMGIEVVVATVGDAP